MNKLLKKHSVFKWTEKCESVFQSLKDALLSSDILVYPDFLKEIILYTDTSHYSLGYILGQKDDKGRERVITYGGRALTPAEIKFPVTHKEALAIISGIKHYNVYLAQSPFTVMTDYSALTSLPTKKRYEGRLVRWSLFLHQYNYTVQAKKGKQNTNADFLSRIYYDTHTLPHTVQQPEVYTQDVAFHTQHTNSQSKCADNERKFTEYTLGYSSAHSPIERSSLEQSLTPVSR